jgi:hypothetical protein
LEEIERDEVSLLNIGDVAVDTCFCVIVGKKANVLNSQPKTIFLHWYYIEENVPLLTVNEEDNSLRLGPILRCSDVGF